jgi:histidine triad (HIT) family protein
LVIPKVHVSDLWAIEQPLDSELLAAAVWVGRAVTRALRPDGMNLITSKGPSAEQTIFHLHFHIVPRWNDDGFGKIWPETKTAVLNDADLASIAARIRDAISDFEI